jgi:hypothetical protein
MQHHYTQPESETVNHYCHKSIKGRDGLQDKSGLSGSENFVWTCIYPHDPVPHPTGLVNIVTGRVVLHQANEAILVKS